MLASSSRPSQARKEPAADSPPSSSQPPSAARVTTAPAGDGTGRSCTGTDTLAVVPQLTMGWCSDAARAEHFALAVAGTQDDWHPGTQPELGGGHGLETADDGVGRHDARELAQGRSRQLAYDVAVEVVEPAARGERRVGDHLVGHAVDDEVARRQQHVRRLEALGLVRRQPGQLRRHGAGVERNAGAGPVDVVATHLLGQRPCLGGRPVVRPQDALADGVALAPTRGRRSAGRLSTTPRPPRRRPGVPARGPRRRR